MGQVCEHVSVCLFVCLLCVRARARVRACVRACVRGVWCAWRVTLVGRGAGERECVCVCVWCMTMAGRSSTCPNAAAICAPKDLHELAVPVSTQDKCRQVHVCVYTSCCLGWKWGARARERDQFVHGVARTSVLTRLTCVRGESIRDVTRQVNPINTRTNSGHCGQRGR